MPNSKDKSSSLAKYKCVIKLSFWLSHLTLEAIHEKRLGTEFSFQYIYTICSHRQNSHNHNTSTSNLNEASLMCGGFIVQMLHTGLTGRTLANVWCGELFHNYLKNRSDLLYKMHRFDIYWLPQNLIISVSVKERKVGAAAHLVERAYHVLRLSPYQSGPGLIPAWSPLLHVIPSLSPLLCLSSAVPIQ